MKNYLTKVKHEETESISVCFNIEHDKVMTIGEKMNEINESAYMNGYNWEALFNYYLEKHHPDLLEEMDTDPEAGMYVAYFEQNAENEKRADKLIEIIESLIENESVLYELIKNDAENIEWD